MARRGWYLPLALFLLLLTPLLRTGFPATAAGLGYAPLPLAVALAGGAVLVGLATARLWGHEAAWWGAALWLTLPLLPSLLYQSGAADLLTPAAGFAPYALLTTVWPDPASMRGWLSAPVLSLGWVPLLLAGLALLLAWPRRDGRRILLLVAGAGALVALALLGGPARPALIAAATLLVLAAAALPHLDARYGRLPVLLGLLALSALSSVPGLRPAWVEDVSRGDAPIATFADGALSLVRLDATREGGALVAEALWQVNQSLASDPTAFVHFLDAPGNQVAQADALLTDGEGLPASAWPVGYLVRQRYAANGPPATQLRFGLYDQASGARFAPSPSREGADFLLFDVGVAP